MMLRNRREEFTTSRLKLVICSAKSSTSLIPVGERWATPLSQESSSSRRIAVMGLEMCQLA